MSEELLSDCRVDVTRTGVESATRVIHLPTGYTATDREGQSQLRQRERCIQQIESWLGEDSWTT